MNLIIFILSTVGLSNILVHGSILNYIKIRKKSIRQWLSHWEWSESLFSCYECTGTWAGFICGALIFDPWYYFLLYGFAGGVLSSWNNLLFEYINSNIDFIIDDGSIDAEETDQS